MKFNTKLQVIPALVALAWGGSALAAGFQLQNQSGSGNGNAFAGAAAAAEDASTIFFNPAGMSLLPRGHNISASATVQNRSIKFTDTGTTNTLGIFPLTPGNGGDAGGVSVLPHGYWAYGVNANLSLGLGIGPTYGNKTEYDFNNFVGRNSGYFFDMRQININPSIAYKINEKVSFGAGLNIAKNESHFRQGVARVSPGFLPNNFLDLKASDWAVGYNLGALFQLTPATRVGVSYRSELKFNLEGTQRYASPNVAMVNQDVKAELKTPANFSLAVAHQANSKLELLADWTWTDWSVVKNLDVKNKQTGTDLHRLSYNFKDSWRVGFGANYQLRDDLKLRFGVAYDKTPVQNDVDRTMTLPDADRTWLSVGAKYKLSKAASVDVSYTHIFFANVKTAREVTMGYPGAQTLAQTVRGTFDTKVDMLAAQLNYNF